MSARHVCRCCQMVAHGHELVELSEIVSMMGMLEHTEERKRRFVPDDIATQIRRMREVGVSIPYISAATGVSRDTVRRVLDDR